MNISDSFWYFGSFNSSCNKIIPERRKRSAAFFMGFHSKYHKFFLRTDERMGELQRKREKNDK